MKDPDYRTRIRAGRTVVGVCLLTEAALFLFFLIRLILNNT